MLEAVFLQAADLLWGGETFVPALAETVEQESRFARRLHGVGQDAQFFQCGSLLCTGRAGLPAKGRHIAGKVFGLNAHLVLQRVNQLRLFAALFFQLLGKRLFALSHHILAGLCGGVLNILRPAALGQIVGHLPGHSTVLTDKVGGAAQLVLVSHPEEIEEQQVFLARGEAGAAPHHLAVEAAHLRGPQHDDAVHRGAVPALGEEHGVAEHVVLVGFEIRKHLSAVGALAVDLGGAKALRVEQVPELLARLDEGQEHHRFAPGTACCHFFSNLAQVRVKSSAKLAYGIIAAAHAHGGDVQLEGDGLGHDAAEVAVFDGIGQLVLIGQAVEHLAEVSHIAPVGGSGHAQDLRTAEVVKDAAIAVGDGMVGLVDDDGPEVVPGEALESCGAL